jgi:hypothetical protein
MRHIMRQEKRRVTTASLFALATMIVIAGTLSGFQPPAAQGNPSGGNFIPNGTTSPTLGAPLRLSARPAGALMRLDRSFRVWALMAGHAQPATSPAMV